LNRHHDGVKIHYKKSGENFYFCVAEESDSIRVCHAFLDDVETKFLKLVNKSKSNVNSLLEDRLAYYNNSDNDKIKKLRAAIGEIKDIMIDNIGMHNTIVAYLH
jgi:hypothetical protein